MSVTKEAFGNEYTLYTITNENGMQAKVTDLGGTLVSLLFQDKNENVRDVVLGYDTPEEYKKNGFFFGAWVGRSGNRIDKAKFALDGKTYQLAVNDNENNLHSGMDYFHLRKAEVVSCTEDSVTFEIKDADLQQGYPGNFTAQVTYTLTPENALKLSYKAKCDQDTVCNMTNHSYFNLGGHDSGSIEDTQLCLSCKEYTPVIDSQSIPTGEYRPVAGTAFDFTAPKAIGQDIGADDEQLKFVGGYDHNYVIAREKGTVVKFAEAYQPKTGICMECYSDLPGVQLYVGNFITDHTGKGGAAYGYRNGFCLETQYYPNAINQEGFAKPILKAGEEFESVTCYKFSVK
ncbi:MAG TPA: galactose-1-epimerase [Lachnospiraceae bacterium]|nr:galactose-1-epimerase [Lachnospiraceae bacterium]